MITDYRCDETVYDADGVLEVAKILIVSATQCNVTDDDSLEYHRHFCPSIFAPILGYFEEVTEDDLELFSVDGVQLSNEDIGKTMFRVERGHHRATVAVESGINVKYTLSGK